MNRKKEDILNLFFNDMVSFSSQTGFLKFAYQSRAHWMIACLIGGSDSKGISFEEICEKISRNLISRYTIQSIINDGINLKFYLKNPSIIDKRVQLLKLSKDAQDAINLWISRQQEIFS